MRTIASFHPIDRSRIEQIMRVLSTSYADAAGAVKRRDDSALRVALAEIEAGAQLLARIGETAPINPA